MFSHQNVKIEAYIDLKSDDYLEVSISLLNKYIGSIIQKIENSNDEIERFVVSYCPENKIWRISFIQFKNGQILSNQIPQGPDLSELKGLSIGATAKRDP